MMCKYCSGLDDSKYLFRKKYRFFDWVSSLSGIVMQNGEIEVSLSLGSDWIEENVKINFCPMCGKKLKDEKA